MTPFSRVIMAPATQPEIAKVNLKTGVLFLNEKIWKDLPAEEKNYVLFHEAGHLQLNTADEFAANQYAVSNFAPVGTLTNEQLAQKITVMRSILDKADDNYAGFAIADIVGGIFQNLQVLGIGSKARAAEAKAAAEANATATAANSKANTKLLLIGGTFLMVGIVIFFTLKK